MDRRPLAAALAALCTLLACTDSRRTATPSASPTTGSPSPSESPSPTVSGSPTPSAAPSSLQCPTSYAAPDPQRPRVTLAFAVRDDKSGATGHEQVVFRPDLPVDRLVFRLWANEPAARKGGGHTEVSRVVVNARPVSFSVSSAGTLVSIPLGRRVMPGETIGVDLDFTLTLPSGVNERLGHRGGTAWFGSGFPLLAWERGHGWATEPPTSAFAEAATSEEFALDLSVDTAPGDVVLGTGAPVSSSGRVRRRHADSVRDVLVAVGPFTVARGAAGGVPVTVGVAPGLPDSASRLVPLHTSAIAAHAARYGPFPYASLDVAVVPDVHGGIEFPGGIILGTKQDRDATLVHEVAHEWFYGMVGDDQARDPWLDEAFATYSEALVNHDERNYLGALGATGAVGTPMSGWISGNAYGTVVYGKGAAALLTARDAAGAAAFDDALRCYVRKNAFGVAGPDDLRDALQGLPKAIDVLVDAGAI